jgi:hypothetical protein
MEAVCSSETFASTYKSIRHCYPEHHLHYCENLKPYIMEISLFFKIMHKWGGAVVAQLVSDYRLGDRRSIPGRGKGFFPLVFVFSQALRPTEPPWPFLGAKAHPGSDSDRPLSSSIEVKNE